jgi:hypothetical protein
MKHFRDNEDREELLSALEKALNSYEELAWKNGIEPYSEQMDGARMTFKKYGGYFESDQRRPWKVG